ncbi:4-amino-4-deoxy-L-arabinose transferase-like glycosyltransferase [Brevibacterium sanguinis]|uniref:4-amino-4-deoxy-L-arabinose transferase-like glycosyltransferase n=2 Tax=Brevibacterium TaxID=1696 RepID=A0A366IEU0_9MICO|nr:MULTISPECIES: glycosyltransferase family 39 protein [Brevibacterium]RBP62361.1 4-amino-4-deoxy-L-arabinose transferase-like glycosyltransferase [Brevibacterium sanguinis]RBP68750.1 4-amino-4-deoxy-L-arabinose transferase-like glycosyltransferase [Brevibacterium celere]
MSVQTEATMRERAEQSRVARWWYPVGLAGLCLAVVAGYLVDLTGNGWANSYYAAAVQAGSQDWEAFLFGSLDAANAITVDKPPASLWLMALSARILGFSSFSMLLPQVLLAAATVLLLAHSMRLALRGHVRARIEKAAALGVGLVFALSPVAALMFRYNNPDALLVALMTVAVVATQRALAAVRVRRVIGRLALTGVALGLGFLTKQFQVLLITPALALAWLLFARASWPRRLLLVLVPIAVMAVSAGWWIALVELLPSHLRPYVGGSQTDSFLELTFGYNGFGRLNGNEAGSVGGAGGWGETGIARLFTGSFGAQIAWFLPTALVLLVVAALVLVLRRRQAAAGRRLAAPDASPGSAAAALVLWGGWLVVTWLTLSYMSGIVHEYYGVALVPALAAVIGLAVALLVDRGSRNSRIVLGLVLALTVTWQFVLASGMSGIPTPLTWGVLVLGVGTGIALVLHGTLSGPRWTAPVRGAAIALLVAAVLSTLALPAQLTARTIAQETQGSIVTIAGTSANGPGGGGGPGGGRAGGGQTDGGQTGGPGGQAGGGGMGGLLNGSAPSAELASVLEADADQYTWIAATTGANQAAGYQLSTGEPVLAIGGFNGTDPSPTVEEFAQLVADGRIHWYIAGGNGGPGGALSSTSAQIQSWVEENFTATEVDGITLYDLGAGEGSGDG